MVNLVVQWNSPSLVLIFNKILLNLTKHSIMNDVKRPLFIFAASSTLYFYMDKQQWSEHLSQTVEYLNILSHKVHV